MALVEKKGVWHIDERLPWAQPPFEDACSYEEGVELGRANSWNVTVLDYEPHLKLHRAYILLWHGLSHDRHPRDRSFSANSKHDLQQVFDPDFHERDQQDDLMSRLEEAARVEDARAFSRAVTPEGWRDWLAEDFVQAVRLALEVGAHVAARRISAEGARLYPEDSEIQKFSRALAPPKLISKSAPPDPGLQADQEWLETHRGEFRGRWVALRDGKLLGVSSSLEELTEEVGDTEGTLLTTGY